MSMLATGCQVEVSHEDMNRYTLIYSSFPAAVNTRARGLSLRITTAADGWASIVGSSGSDRNPQELESRRHTKPGMRRIAEWTVAQAGSLSAALVPK